MCYKMSARSSGRVNASLSASLVFELSTKTTLALIASGIAVQVSSWTLADSNGWGYGGTAKKSQ